MMNYNPQTDRKQQHLWVPRLVGENRWPDSSLAEVLAKHEKGMTITALGMEYGITRQGMSLVLRRAKQRQAIG